MKTRKNKSRSTKFKKTIKCNRLNGSSRKQHCERRSRRVHTRRKKGNAIANFKLKNNVSGFVKFFKYKKYVKVIYKITGLSDGLHGFHIHQKKVKNNDCSTAAGHFNPDNINHSGRHSHKRHAGDFGNIRSKNNKSAGSFIDSKISLDKNSKYYIVGRSIVVHEKMDDLGKGGNIESKITGNAGKRLNCASIKIIG